MEADDQGPGPAVAVVHAHLRDPRSGWSIGTFGAVAEFFRHGDEPADLVRTADGGSVATARGAIRIGLTGGVRVLAHEGLSGYGEEWTQGVAFCLAGAEGSGKARPALTELGPDGDAIRPEHRDFILFDLGLGIPHVDFCVRTGDAALLAAMRRAAGRAILAPGNPALQAIKEASPHRICVSALGRIEVYQPIASNTPTPEGPHTHLLPRLLESGRTHATNTPVADGFFPCLNLYPPSPLVDTGGRARAFDAALHRRFQRLLSRFGPPAYVAEKRRIAAAVLAGDSPRSYRPAKSRLARTGAAIALRQMAHTHPDAPGLDLWREALGRADGPAGDGQGG